MGVYIENGGILTTVQDGGRHGFEQFGVTNSGPMDFFSMNIANVLVGNEIDESCLEATFSGPALRFTADAVCAVTGAECCPTLNKARIAQWQAFCVHKGDVLKLGTAKAGCRSYIAIAGGIKVPPLMNSKSTQLGQSFGGHEGRRLQKGDELEFEKEISILGNMQSRYFDAPEFPANGEVTLRVIMGPQDYLFSEEGIRRFLNESYTVTPESDRQGYRLCGPEIEHLGDGNIISDGIVNGSIQVPGTDQPIIMLAEHQTTGGYAKIAGIISVDLPLIGQCSSGDTVRFRAVSIEEAHKEYIAYHRMLKNLKTRIDKGMHKKHVHYLLLSVNDHNYRVRVEKRED